MKIDWKRKLTSRKFWMAVAGLVTGIVILIQSQDRSTEAIGGIIMSAGAVVAYIIGEGMADSGNAAVQVPPEIIEEGDEENAEDLH